jgi:methylmalonyl-CoA mutase
MADVQQFFIDNEIKKFYSVSISGYHIGEAGATPIQEMAFTTANGFTYLENYMARGMHVDDICRNFSFFFRDSNEIEWIALGPVLRKIWAIAIRDIYGGNARSQQFKYHTQTSGRALQVMEWDTLNPLRQTYQALIALLGGTNSLHVDSADEPLTTPSEKFVRQATMIPNYLTLEVELLKQQNILSGSYAMRDLNAQVQEEVLQEFMRLDDQGGVPQAMELDYQRAAIAEASLNYEIDIWNGTRPIIGRNTAQADVTPYQLELMRPTDDDFKLQLERTNAFKARNEKVRELHLAELRKTINAGENVFDTLMDVMRFCTLGQTSRVLANEGGKFSQTI